MKAVEHIGLEKLEYKGMLYDFYGELLTQHQKGIYEDAVFNDLSLGEIADEQGISRQGVHDLVRRCDKALLEYEKKLKLIARFMKIKEQIQEINDLSRQYEQSETGDKAEYCRKLRQLSAEILETL